VDTLQKLRVRKRRPDKLIRLLRVMAATSRIDMQELHAFRLRGDREEAGLMAPSIRGAAVTLGARAVPQAGLALE
jgi:hypothetical protein